MHHWLFLVSLSLSLFADAPCAQSDVAPAKRSQIAAARNQLTERYAERIAQLAEKYDADGLAEPAQLLRGWLPQRDPLKLYIFKLPDSLEAPEAFTASDAAKKEWQAFVELRRTQAAALFRAGAEGSCRKAICALV